MYVTIKCFLFLYLWMRKAGIYIIELYNIIVKQSMHAYICMYVCIYACMYAYMYVCVCVCVCVYACLYVCVICMYACMQWPNDLGIAQVIKRSQVHSRCCCHFLEQESLPTLLQSTQLYWRELAITRHANVNLVMPGLCGWSQGRTMDDHTIICDAWPVLLWTLVLSPGAFGCTDSEYLCGAQIFRHIWVDMTVRIVATG